jgi:hypothetical protein
MLGRALPGLGGVHRQLHAVVACCPGRAGVGRAEARAGAVPWAAATKPIASKT